MADAPHDFVLRTVPDLCSVCFETVEKGNHTRPEPVAQQRERHIYVDEATNTTHVAKAAQQTSPQGVDDYVAWLRYAQGPGDSKRIVVCDSDEPGAFKVYRAAHARELAARDLEWLTAMHAEDLDWKGSIENIVRWFDGSCTCNHARELLQARLATELKMRFELAKCKTDEGTIVIDTARNAERIADLERQLAELDSN